ncbi:MAG: ribosomal-processing cysteine protease Prp [Lachnospiraceae bacterium]|nr:ribosomal-processing cysteine protease Prp [Lachnospiraceae bacterium]
MISITIEKSGEAYRKVSCIGHAGFAQSGTDIVCAAASVLVINTLNAIEALTDTTFEAVSEKETGKLVAHFTDGISDQATLLLDAMVMGLSEMTRQYGQRYITLEVKEAAL